VAAQQLAGNGFTNVINLSGGFKVWTGQSAFDGEKNGLELLTDLSKPTDVLIMAYSLEEGLQDFYNSMVSLAESKEVIKVFTQLAAIEDLHKDRLFKEYTRITGSDDKEKFLAKMQKQMLEGGLTTEEYLSRFGTDLERVDEVVGMAMSIEGQALDLYSKAAQRTEDADNKMILEKIAAEEKTHLERLGGLMDSILGENDG
jgi:rubrerythrin